MDRPTCATCVFYEDGFCHKNPPHYVADHDWAEGGEMFVTSYMSWPKVSETDWCGQHNRFVAWQLAQPVEVSK